MFHTHPSLLTIIVLVLKLELIQSKCDVPVKIYNDLRCKPTYSEDLLSLCPKQYDCTHLVHEKLIANRDKMCYFDGRWYNIGDQIRIPAVCGVGVCRCMKNLNFECTKEECPYTHLPDVNNCFLAYGFDKCCSKTYHCSMRQCSAIGNKQYTIPNVLTLSNWKNLTTCDVNDTVYLEGELFPSPIDNCKLCVCNKDFDTHYGINVCRSIPCKLELLRSVDILNNCALVYLDSSDCCPVDIKCPSNADLDAFKREVVTQNDTYCNYGPIKVKSGLRLVNTVDEYGSITVTECSCKIPPLMTCYRTYYS